MPFEVKSSGVRELMLLSLGESIEMYVIILLLIKIYVSLLIFKCYLLLMIVKIRIQVVN